MRRIQGWIAVALLAALVATVLVAGCGSGDETAEAERPQPDPAAVKAAEQKALANYEKYLGRESDLLLKWGRLLEDEIAGGDQFGATFRYANSRVHYGHLQPAARLLPRQDSQVNGSFHEIERGLYGKEATEGLKPVAARLIAEIQSLGRALEGSELQPAALAKASDQLMKEVSGRMMDGKEEPHSRLDLLDVSASIEGTEKAFAVLKPQLESEDPRLVRKIEYEFLEAYERLAEHGNVARLQPGPEAGTNFIIYNYLDSVELEEISEPIDSLTRLFGEVAEQFEGS